MISQDLTPLPFTPRVLSMIDQAAESLSQWRTLASNYDVPKTYLEDVGKYIQVQCSRLSKL